jgi:hypothetical protein
VQPRPKDNLVNRQVFLKETLNLTDAVLIPPRLDAIKLDTRALRDLFDALPSKPLRMTQKRLGVIGIEGIDNPPSGWWTT